MKRIDCLKCGDKAYWIRYRDVYWCPVCDWQGQPKPEQQIEERANKGDF